MLKMFQRFRNIDWVFLAIIVGLTVMQVWCTMMMVDYMADIITSITYLSYQTEPSQLGDAFLAIFNSSDINGSWENLIAALEKVTLPDPTIAPMLEHIANASMGDIWLNGGMMLLVTASSAIIPLSLVRVSAEKTTMKREKEENEKQGGRNLP